MNIKKLAKLATITVHSEPEHIPVRGNALASGDDAIDRATEDEIIARLDAGDEWAWCCVVVSARLGACEGRAYLGCCSYASEADFIGDGYYEQMREEALEALAAEITVIRSTDLE